MIIKCSFCDYTRQDWLKYKSGFYPGNVEFQLACYDNHPLHYHTPLFGIDELQMKHLVINEIKSRHPELDIGFYDIKIY